MEYRPLIVFDEKLVQHHAIQKRLLRFGTINGHALHIGLS